MTRLTATAVCLLALVLVAQPAGAAAPAQDDAPVDDGSTDSVDDLPDRARSIIGSPDPGPKPEHPGDRGGWAQLMTLGVLVAAVGFIMWRVLDAARAAPADVTPPGLRRSPSARRGSRP